MKKLFAIVLLVQGRRSVARNLSAINARRAGSDDEKLN